MNKPSEILMKFVASSAKKAQEEQNVFVDKSSIEGKGLFAGRDIRKGEVIGLAHSDGQPVGSIGKFHNHSEQPNAISVKQGSERYLIATNDLPFGAEITTDYRMQPELEQPSPDWQMKSGGQHGGLDRWFAEKWVDVKTGKECGRQKGEKRKGYPACRPSKRISEDTPKTSSEMSASEKEKFKRTKTSSERIPYQHKRKAEGGEQIKFDMENMKNGGNVPTNPELWSRAKAAAKAKYDVYPSAYANGFAAKWYKERGGGWRKAEMGGCMECGGQMEYGGEPANAGFQALPEYVQAKIMANSKQEGGDVEQQSVNAQMEEMMTQIALMIKEGTDPMEVLQSLIEQGVPQQEAEAIIQEVLDSLEDNENVEEEDVDASDEELEMMANGGIPDRYRKQGFTRVGAKRRSTRPGKKWMVLAKKGDKYKIVHGGYKGMSDYTQHRNEKRRNRFWNRMGGKDSSKARDPFSPLYWHKRFGTWQKGGETTEPLGYTGYVEGDSLYTNESKYKLENVADNPFTRGLAYANVLGDPRSMMWALPNKGLLGKVKGIAGAAAGLSGAALGYAKMFSQPKTESYINNTKTNEFGTMKSVLENRAKKNAPAPAPAQNATPAPTTKMTRTGGSGMGAMEYLEQQQDVFSGQTQPVSTNAPLSNMTRSGGSGMGAMETDQDMFIKQFGGMLYGDYVAPAFMYGGQPLEMYQNAGQAQPMSYDEWLAANGRGAMGMEAYDMRDYQAYLKQFGQQPANNVVINNPTPPAGNLNQTPQNQQRKVVTSSSTSYGDDLGMVAANNALAGFGMLNSVLGERDYMREYTDAVRRSGNTMEKYNAQNAVNPFGTFTLNAGVGQNFGLVANPTIQDFGTRMAAAKYGGPKSYRQGGEYYMSDDEIQAILAMGGEIEFLD